jgi:rhodanese-related sulfurtransferase
MKKLACVLLIGLGPLLASAVADEGRIVSLAPNGFLTWTNSSLSVTCRVEWAPSVEGPWCSSWDSLSNIVVTNYVTVRSVPMFYRVVTSLPQIVTNITPAASLALLDAHRGDTNFIILDVRTAGEYAPRHIKQAVNLDYYSATFQQDLAALDKSKTYLVYCGSGSRSGKTLVIMQTLGFAQVYGMLNGFSAFAALPGAAEWLEP